MMQIMSAYDLDMSTYGLNDSLSPETGGGPASHIPALEGLALAATFRS